MRKQFLLKNIRSLVQYQTHFSQYSYYSCGNTFVKRCTSSNINNTNTNAPSAIQPPRAVVSTSTGVDDNNKRKNDRGSNHKTFRFILAADNRLLMVSVAVVVISIVSLQNTVLKSKQEEERRKISREQKEEKQLEKQQRKEERQAKIQKVKEKVYFTKNNSASSVSESPPTLPDASLNNSSDNISTPEEIVANNGSTVTVESLIVDRNNASDSSAIDAEPELKSKDSSVKEKTSKVLNKLKSLTERQQS